VYDGDTIYVNIPGLPPVFGDDLGIRFRGVDTPEMRSRCKTQAAKDREKAFAVRVRDKLRQKIVSGQYLLIHNLHRGSFFRVVADVEVDGESLNQWLLDNHYAYAVVDEKMRPGYWCDADNY
jgi:endonuclease YncB( thermonuclease family)